MTFCAVLLYHATFILTKDAQMKRQETVRLSCTKQMGSARSLLRTCTCTLIGRLSTESSPLTYHGNLLYAPLRLIPLSTQSHPSDVIFVGGVLLFLLFLSKCTQFSQSSYHEQVARSSLRRAYLIT